MFQFDPVLFAFRLLPSLVRQKATHRAWIRVLFGLVTSRMSSLKAYRQQINTELTYSPQTVVMHRMLAEVFNDGQPGIYIEDFGLQPAQVYLYRLAENEPTPYTYHLDEANPDEPLYLYRLGESPTDYDAIVWVPTSVINLLTEPDKVSQLKAWLRRYKFAGVRFKLENYA